MWLFCWQGARAAHPIPESERWATITHPGNAPYVFQWAPGYPFQQVGSVDHEYQISRTEVTAAEWLEFVNAYAPYVDPGYANSPYFRSNRCYRTGPTTYDVIPEWRNLAVDVGWRFAARYVNWLHNGKANTPGAFESGVYDTATFRTNPDGTFTDQQAHSPGARYWIPTQDELIKAFHFDPDRYGPDQPGYWLYSHTSDSPPRPGLPEQGGEASFQRGGPSMAIVPEVAAYRNVQSPWGLWDAAGGVEEYTETPRFAPGATLPLYRLTDGSSWHVTEATSRSVDNIGGWRSAGPLGTFVGLRVARAIPSPTGALVFACALIPHTRRRRNADEPAFPHRVRVVHDRPASRCVTTARCVCRSRAARSLLEGAVND